jgi:hypothetical protein
MAEEERGDYGGPFYVPPTLDEALRNRGLGEVPRSLGVERKELEAYDLEGRRVPPAGPGSAEAVADLQRATGIVHTVETQKISPRPPALLYQVVSMYDSRPIQGYDFQKSECSFINWAGVPPVFAPFDAVNFIVPNNVVAVVRHFQYQVIDAPVNAVVEGDCWLQSDMFVNDLPVRNYNKMIHPVFMEDAFPTFIIVDERLEIRLQLSIFDPNNTEFSQTLNGLQAPVIANIYGNLILKTGVPIEFEIANAIGGGQL